MFVYSVKGNTLKFAGIICLAIVLTLSLLIFIPKNDSETAAAVGEEKINYGKIKTNDDRVKFLEQFGWTVESDPVEEVTVKIPKTFDKVLSSYNNIQLHQGLDLSKYSGKEVTRYTYKVTNYPDYSGEVIANIIIYKSRVIGGDVCSCDVDGFIRDLTFPKDSSENTITPPADTSGADTSPVPISPDAEAPSDTQAPPDTASPSEGN